jgi:integrase
MAKRRGNKEGTIYKKANGTWRTQISLNGRRLSFTGKSRGECQNWIKETTQQIDQGFTFEGADTTLKEFLSDWLVSIASSRSKSTVERYGWVVKHEILPLIGQYKLKDLKPDLLQGFYDHKIKNGRSNYMVRTTHKILNIALMHAVKLGILARNPCKATTPPRFEQKEMRIYDENQIQVLLNTALALGDQFYPLYYLAIHTGMRQAELIGLKWEDLDWEKRTLQVRRQVVRFYDGSYEFSKPKSKAGYRTVTLGKQVLEVLRAQQEKVWQMRKTGGENWQEFDLMFPTRVGTPIQNCNLRRGFRKLLQESGLPKIRFHDLRHTAASLMLNYGIPVLIVSRRLGHAKASITLDVYGHLVPGKQEEAATLMDELMTPVSLEIAPKLHPNYPQVAEKPRSTPR